VIFVDVHVHVNPETGCAIALVMDGPKLVQPIFGEGNEPAVDARRRALEWCRRNHYLVTNARAA
jgi:hypothetical protein